MNKFKTLSSLTGRKVIALGGISEENIKKLSLLDVQGFSGITYFDKKKAPWRGLSLNKLSLQIRMQNLNQIGKLFYHLLKS